MKRMQGTSVVEVAMALLIAALLVGVAVPASVDAYVGFHVNRARLAISESVLVSSRTAVGTGTATVMCPTDAGARCRDDSDWSRGWLVFADTDDDREFGPSDTLVQRLPALAGGVSLSSNAGRPRLVFQPDGGSAGSNLTFAVCGRAGQRAETWVLSNSGRFRLAPASAGQALTCRRD